jgi:integrase
MLIEIEARVARGMVGIEEPDEKPQLTVAELCEKFLAEFASPRIKDMTNYRRSAKFSLKRVISHIGHIQLSALTQSHVEKVRDLLSKRYRPNTVRASMRPLGTALSWAVRQELIDQSPLRGIDMPRRELAVEYLSADEAARLLAEAERQAKEANRQTLWVRWIAISLALRLGLRRGEVFGLRWQDINLDAGKLTVAKSYRLAPKSNRPRHLPIPSVLLPLLREWQFRCPESAERLVCPLQHNGRWQMSSPRAGHGLTELLEAVRCKPLLRGWHALRHTFASHFIMGGGNLLTLQKLLGHVSIEMTLVYSHLAPDFVAGEVERLKY